METAAVFRFAIVARGCAGDLTNKDQLLDVAQRAVTSSGLNIVAAAAHAFVPHGLTVALVLAQSHLVISTWPEHRAATVEIAVCAERVAAESIWHQLGAYLRPASTDIVEETISIAEPGLLGEPQPSSNSS